MIEIKDEAYLYNQLVKLGDMMGDGLHHEPDGEWIVVEYRKTMKALGLLPKQKRKTNTSGINDAVGEKLKTEKCTNCNGELKQTRSGSLTVKCVECESRFKFKRGKK